MPLIYKQLRLYINLFINPSRNEGGEHTRPAASNILLP